MLKNLYQITLLFNPILEEKEVLESFQKIQDWIEKKEGAVKEKDISKQITRKKLAYPIDKCEDAYFLTFVVQLEAENINSLNDKIASEENIIRHLLTHKKEIQPQAKKEKPKTEEKSQSSAKAEEEIIDKIESLKEADTESKSADTEEKAPASEKETAPSQTEEKTEKEKPTEENGKKSKDDKAKIEELDKKLDEILKE